MMVPNIFQEWWNLRCKFRNNTFSKMRSWDSFELFIVFSNLSNISQRKWFQDPYGFWLFIRFLGLLSNIIKTISPLQNFNVNKTHVLHILKEEKHAALSEETATSLWSQRIPKHLWPAGKLIGLKSQGHLNGLGGFMYDPFDQPQISISGVEFYLNVTHLGCKEPQLTLFTGYPSVPAAWHFRNWTFGEK